MVTKPFDINQRKAAVYQYNKISTNKNNLMGIYTYHSLNVVCSIREYQSTITVSY